MSIYLKLIASKNRICSFGIRLWFLVSFHFYLLLLLLLCFWQINEKKKNTRNPLVTILYWFLVIVSVSISSGFWCRCPFYSIKSIIWITLDLQSLLMCVFLLFVHSFVLFHSIRYKEFISIDLKFLKFS